MSVPPARNTPYAAFVHFQHMDDPTWTSHQFWQEAKTKCSFFICWKLQTQG